MSIDDLCWDYDSDNKYDDDLFHHYDKRKCRVTVFKTVGEYIQKQQQDTIRQ